MAHGENAEKRGRPGNEYGSRRLRGWPTWCPWSKWYTHRVERRRAKREMERAIDAGDIDDAIRALAPKET